MATPKTYTLAQVKKQCSLGNDVWIVLHDKVYNVTKFLSEHPGGEEVLREVSGKDGSKEFDDVGHSDAAIELLKDFYVGELADSDKKKKSGCCFARLLCGNKNNVVFGVSSAVAVALGAFLVYQGIKVLKN